MAWVIDVHCDLAATFEGPVENIKTHIVNKL